MSRLGFSLWPSTERPIASGADSSRMKRSVRRFFCIATKFTPQQTDRPTDKPTDTKRAHLTADDCTCQTSHLSLTLSLSPSAKYILHCTSEPIQRRRQTEPGQTSAVFGCRGGGFCLEISPQIRPTHAYSLTSSLATRRTDCHYYSWLATLRKKRLLDNNANPYDSGAKKCVVF